MTCSRETLDARSIRRETAPDWDYWHVEVAKAAKTLRDAGVKIQVGGHGQGLAQGGLGAVEVAAGQFGLGLADLGQGDFPQFGGLGLAFLGRGGQTSARTLVTVECRDVEVAPGAEILAVGDQHDRAGRRAVGHVEQAQRRRDSGAHVGTGAHECAFTLRAVDEVRNGIGVERER